MGDLNHLFAIGLVFPLVVFLGGYLTIRLKFLQFIGLKKAASLILKPADAQKGGFSAFEALSAIVAGNIGTGNITGMAVAFATGGPGALLWMWVMAFLGSILQYATCVLGGIYREKNPRGEYVGGPMYVLQRGVGSLWLGRLFAICAIFGAVTVGNLAQLHSLSTPFEELGIPPWSISTGVMMLAGAVLLGGISRFARLASILVPMKALLYFGGCCWIIAIHWSAIPEALNILLFSAFGWGPMGSGAAGFGMARAISAGFERGIFATDAAIGTAPILQANAQMDDPVKRGLISLLAPVLVMFVCTATGLVLILTGVWTDPSLQGTQMVTHAFVAGMGHEIGCWIVLISLFVFAFTTVLSWGCCYEKAWEFITGGRYRRILLAAYVFLIPLGSFCSLSLVWGLSDLAIALMLISNVYALLRLLPRVVRHTEDYFGQPHPLPSSLSTSLET